MTDGNLGKQGRSEFYLTWNFGENAAEIDSLL
jgi:hypothetical protein